MTRRRRILTLAALAAVVVAAGVGLWVRSGPAEPVGLGTRTVQAGEVTVTMTALVLDTAGARFRIALDTHSGSLTLDLARAARLRLNGQVIPAGTWDAPHPVGTTATAR